ncbi:MAG: hypothetical protein DYG98_06390 [Haliscomenobacteraceae bacterium CHB4]|nr:hypothetical protein [Saprospiraceae bacterium]MCE7922665.1 hypothetical protein [Haliscomenobacteraceae bacterium CHB4]
MLKIIRSLFVTGFLLPLLLQAQLPLLTVPQEQLPADSVAQLIYRLAHPDPEVDKYGIEYTRRFGWLKMSDKINTDSFFNWTKQYCIERVGEELFYKNFRLYRNSFKDNATTEIYEIRYLFFPFDSNAQNLNSDSSHYAEFVFKSFDFLGIHESQTPANLPDCRLDTSACRFLFDRAAVLRIIAAMGLKSEKRYEPYLLFQPDLTWKVTVNVNDWMFHSFTVDSRSGLSSEVRTSHRID